MTPFFPRLRVAVLGWAFICSALCSGLGIYLQVQTASIHKRLKTLHYVAHLQNALKNQNLQIVKTDLQSVDFHEFEGQARLQAARLALEENDSVAAGLELERIEEDLSSPVSELELSRIALLLLALPIITIIGIWIFFVSRESRFARDLILIREVIEKQIESYKNHGQLDKPDISSKIVSKEWRGLVVQLEALVSKIQTSILETAREQKLITLGDLALSLSRELGAPLLAIETCSREIQNSSLSGTDFEKMSRTHAEKILRSFLRIHKLTQSLLSFAEGSEQFEKHSIHLKKLVQDSLELLEGHLDAMGSRVHLDIPEDLSISVQIQQMEWMIFHLVLNAVEAVGPVGGSIWIQAFLNTEGKIGLQVKDEGPGIKPEVAAKIWDPFFTTKSTEKNGTGLGLALVRQVVLAHKGTIEYRREEDRFTVFEILL